eukprot:3784133-Rhodomonas_salina.1
MLMLCDDSDAVCGGDNNAPRHHMPPARDDKPQRGSASIIITIIIIHDDDDGVWSLWADGAQRREAARGLGRREQVPSELPPRRAHA